MPWDLIANSKELGRDGCECSHLESKPVHQGLDKPYREQISWRVRWPVAALAAEGWKGLLPVTVSLRPKINDLP